MRETAIMDADGRGSVKGRVHRRVRAAGCGLLAAAGVLAGLAGPGKAEVLTWGPPVRVSGTVTVAAGEKFAGPSILRVLVVGERSMTSEPLGEDGKFEALVSGDTIWIYAGDEAPLAQRYAWTMAGPFAGRPGGKIENVRLALKQGFTGLVRVRSAEGKPVSGGRVAAAVVMKGLDTRSLECAEVQADGTAGIENCPDLPVNLHVRCDGYEETWVWGVKLQAGKPVEVALKAGAPTTLRVVEAGTGRPLAGATVSLFQARARLRGMGDPDAKWGDEYQMGPWAKADARGNASITSMAGGDSYWMTVQAEGHEEKIIGPLQAGQAGVAVELGPSIEIGGRIDAAGQKGTLASLGVRCRQLVRLGGGEAERWVDCPARYERQGAGTAFRFAGLRATRTHVELTGVKDPGVYEVELGASLHGLVLPLAGGAPYVETPTVLLRAGGRAFLNGQAVAPEALKAALQDLAGAKPPRKLLIRAGEGVDLRQAADLVNAATMAGIREMDIDDPRTGLRPAGPAATTWPASRPGAPVSVEGDAGPLRLAYIGWHPWGTPWRDGRFGPNWPVSRACGYYWTPEGKLLEWAPRLPPLRLSDCRGGEAASLDVWFGHQADELMLRSVTIRGKNGKAVEGFKSWTLTGSRRRPAVPGEWPTIEESGGWAWASYDFSPGLVCPSPVDLEVRYTAGAYGPPVEAAVKGPLPREAPWLRGVAVAPYPGADSPHSQIALKLDNAFGQTHQISVSVPGPGGKELDTFADEEGKVLDGSTLRIEPWVEKVRAASVAVVRIRTRPIRKVTYRNVSMEGLARCNGPRPEMVAPTPAEATFTPAIERTLGDLPGLKRATLDLESGGVFDAPEALIRAESWAPLAERSRIDVAACITPPEWGPGTQYLAGLGILVVECDNAVWDTLAPAGFDAALAAPKFRFRNFQAAQLPATFLFLTAEGGRGILQITKASGAPAPTVSLRYKLLRAPHSPAPPGT